jgi:hydrogenase maturation protease
MTPRVLIAGIGNIFLGDDAFGCEVVRRLLATPQKAGVRVFDFGIRGFDLTYALLDGLETVILVDAVPRGEAPGTIYLIEPELAALDAVDDQQALVEMHGMDPMKVLRMVRSMGGEVRRILLVGCEPGSFGLEEEGEGRIGLSGPVEAAVEEGVRLIEDLVNDILAKDIQIEKVGVLI